MASIGTLTASFDQGLVIGAGFWSTTLSGSGTVTGQYGAIYCTHSAGIDFGDLLSFDFYDATGSAASIQVRDYGNQTAAKHEVWFGVHVDTSNFVYWYANAGTLQAWKRIAGVDTAIGSLLTLNVSAHQWLRIRESGGTTFFDTSANGSVWVNQASAANPIAMTSVFPRARTRNFGAGTPGYAIFDNFNTLDPSPYSYCPVRPGNNRVGPMALRRALRGRTRYAAAADDLAPVGTSDTTDTVATVDNATFVIDVVRSFTDTIGSTDTTALDASRASTDPVGVVDDLTPSQGFGRALTDSVSTADTFSTTQDASRTVTDTVGATDAVTLTTDFVTAITDTAGVTDAMNVLAGYQRTWMDNVDTADSATFVVVSPGEANADNLIDLADGLVTAFDSVRAATDVVGAGDSVTFSLGHNLASSDPVGMNDSTGFIADYVRALADPIGVADSATFQIDVVRVDPVGVTDSAQWDTRLELGDLVGGTDVADFATEFVRAFTDPIGVADSATFQLGDNTVITIDTVGLDDSARFDVFAAPDNDSTWIVRAESTVATPPAESTTAAITESATVSILAESTIHAVKAETNRLEL